MTNLPEAPVDSRPRPSDYNRVDGKTARISWFHLERLTVPHSDREIGTMIAYSSLGNLLREIMIMAKPLLPDQLWEVIDPLLPKWTPSPKGGQPPVTDRAALTGILFILKTGLPSEDLPREMNCGCGMTCWRRLRDWQANGTWDKIHKVL